MAKHLGRPQWQILAAVIAGSIMAFGLIFIGLNLADAPVPTTTTVITATTAAPVTTMAPDLAAFLFPEGIQSLDGSGNNLFNPTWGQANQPYLRVAGTNYADDVNLMVDGPPARYISNRIFNDIGQNIFSETEVTQWVFAWGQFLDHTFGLRVEGVTSEPIEFDMNDPLENFVNDFGEIAFERSIAATGTGTSSPRQQTNTVSSYLDAWSVYGGSTARLEWLREGPVDGDMTNNTALLLNEGNYLPKITNREDFVAAPAMASMGRLQGEPEGARVAGDVRANENMALTSIHTMFMREHNRIVGLLPGFLSEEVKFQIARRVVIAELQWITYNEFLPALGVELPAYEGYNPQVNATLSNEFATVGYRAHSMIHGEFEFALDEGRVLTAEEISALGLRGIEITEDGFVIPLNVAFASPDLVEQMGLGSILTGLSTESQYNNDEMIDNQLRSVLFQIPNSDNPECLDGPTLPECFTTLLDLGALDIQRDRDHGIPYYNDLRQAYGLPIVESFMTLTGEDTEDLPDGMTIDDPAILEFIELKDIDGNPTEPGSTNEEDVPIFGVRRSTTAARLKAIYGDINQVDAFVGMLAEPHLPGAELGELQMAMWVKQFAALRDGDRFFYLNDPSLERILTQFDITYQHSLAELIALNTEVVLDDLAANVFTGK